MLQVQITSPVGTIDLNTMAQLLKRLEFSVYGKVQGVWFRKYTKEKATSLGLVGYVQNVAGDKSVHGVAEGQGASIDQMKTWLRETGSPLSRIDNVVFKESDIQIMTYRQFSKEATIRSVEDFGGKSEL
eukprot:TRINITY_DN2753_c0_g1_i1.p1 TRINITY_DN2753_c0_g1~~TRINITY_DN2753_c0_g1_i1.p1  ORF type:complete len:129 (-),score=27.47 TRINITY_DN2753_c0_g1_i1:61-447(-)